MRNFNLDHLQTLIAIADLGNFAAAAQALHLAPPTVSLHIKELESRLQADLVVRGRRQAELTPAGEVLVQEGRQLLLACDDLMERVRRRASGRQGIVRVGVSAGVSTRLLPRMLEALAARCPGVEIRLEAIGSADSMQRLKAGTLDIGIIASPQPPLAEVRQTPWRNDPMVALLPAAWEAPAFATPDWLATRRAPFWRGATPARSRAWRWPASALRCCRWRRWRTCRARPMCRSAHSSPHSCAPWPWRTATSHRPRPPWRACCNCWPNLRTLGSNSWACRLPSHGWQDRSAWGTPRRRPPQIGLYKQVQPRQQQQCQRRQGCIRHPIRRVACTLRTDHKIANDSQRERHRHPAVKPPNAHTGAHCAPPAASWIIFQPLPAGSRKPASTLPYRSTGSCVNSTPWSCSRAYAARQSATCNTSGGMAPLATMARSVCAVAASWMGGPGVNSPS